MSFLKTEKSEKFRISRRHRLRRLREIVHILREHKIFNGLTPVKLRLVLEALGPTYVKVGQILSMRSEMLPQEFCDELVKLRANANPISYETILSVLEQEYKKKPEEIFLSIDPTPLGSASLAQVHRARLVTGELVAVKVQRPGVREIMAEDIDIMRSASSIASKFARNSQIVDFESVVDELWETFQSETDFSVEANGLKEFRKFTAGYRYADCPKPYMHLCTPHVLVMDYIEGISISKPEQLTAAGYDLEEIGIKLVDNYASQILDAGFFHADPHPGNIIVRDGQIVLIDLGMTGRLDTRMRTILSDMIFSVAKRDSQGLESGLLRLSENKGRETVRAELLSDLDDIIEQYGTVDLSDLDLADFLETLLSLARRHKLKLPGTVTTVGRALVTLEGVLAAYIPSVNMIEIISDHIAMNTGIKETVKNEGTKLGTESLGALHGMLKALTDAEIITHQLSRGQLKANIELVGSQEPLRQLSNMVDRITTALIVVGLYVGSSIVYFAGIKPVIFGIPVIGFLGYAAAFVLSVWIVCDIFRQNSRLRRKSEK